MVLFEIQNSIIFLLINRDTMVLSNIPLCICTTSLSILCQYTFRLFPCLGCFKQYCYEHRGSCLFLNYSLSRYMPRSSIIWIPLDHMATLTIERFLPFITTYSTTPLPEHCLLVIPIYIQIPKSQGFPHNSVGQQSACNAGDLGSIPGL